MPNSPHRPFVPKRTLPENDAPESESEFRVVPPFVHGRARRSARPAPINEQPPPLASISDFLAEEEPVQSSDFLATAQPAQAHELVPTHADAWREPRSIGDFVAPEAVADYAATGDVEERGDDSYDLPPIEHFLDPITDQAAPVAPRYELRSEDSFADQGRQIADQFDLPPEDPFAELASPSVADEHGWEETDWQRYDWRSAAALGEAGDPAANSAWAQTDWDNPGSGRRARESAAQAIADALDGIARRIRDGDLVMPQPPAAVPDPATIAATLAALLGVRR